VDVVEGKMRYYFCPPECEKKEINKNSEEVVGVGRSYIGGRIMNICSRIGIALGRGSNLKLGVLNVPE